MVEEIQARGGQGVPVQVPLKHFKTLLKKLEQLTLANISRLVFLHLWVSPEPTLVGQALPTTLKPGACTIQLITAVIHGFL